MDYFLGSVKLMFIVYAIATVISLAVAWIIKGIFAGIRSQQNSKNLRAAQAATDGRA